MTDAPQLFPARRLSKGSILKNGVQMPRLTAEQQTELEQIWRDNGWLTGEDLPDSAAAERWRLMQASELIYRHERGLLDPQGTGQ